jgi:mediator of RNA polymerase II transcription subunit 5
LGSGVTAKFATDIKSKLGQTLTSYIPFISQISIAVGTKLDSFQKQYDLFEERPSNHLGDNLLQGVDGTGLHFEDSVLEGPIVNSRAGLYVYINAMVRERIKRRKHMLSLGLACWTAPGG